MRIWLCLIGGPLFILAVLAHIYVRVRLRPQDDLDDYYYEFEEQHPGYARYLRWYKITMAMASIGVLLMFIALL